jgi:nicotinate-nucleotide pyrophosphorylase (carboxylating)
MPKIPLPDDIGAIVAQALAEDIGNGDLTAQLIPAARPARAEVTLKERAVLCGTAWFDEVFRQLDPSVQIAWQAEDGAEIEAETVVCTLTGAARALLTGERTALNLLQTLSGTATVAREFALAVEGTAARILDTRKTLPGLRRAQKYAVRCGGAHNHRIGLFDAVLIKENHIAAVGSIAEAVRMARANTPHVLIEVEVESLQELRAALATDADRIMLDEFSLDAMREAVVLRDAHGGKRKELEASGSISLDALHSVAATGIDWISIGALTKHVTAIDFSMRIVS